MERQVLNSKAALLLHACIGQHFDGEITGAGKKATRVRVFQPPAEGRLTGAFEHLKVGQAVKVQLTSTSVERGFIEFALTH